jgi:DNA-binding transcriptional ArsR family regulator
MLHFQHGTFWTSIAFSTAPEIALGGFTFRTNAWMAVCVATAHPKARGKTSERTAATPRFHLNSYLSRKVLTTNGRTTIVIRMANNTSQLNDVFGALSDPTRRAIVMRLSAGEASVSELAKPFDMALPSFMKHLRILESCGLIETEKIGRVRTCALHTESLETIEAWLAAQREIWERRLDRLELYVEKLKKEEK